MVYQFYHHCCFHFGAVNAVLQHQCPVTTNSCFALFCFYGYNYEYNCANHMNDKNWSIKSRRASMVIRY